MGVFRLNGKAVSEVLGYILVLSVVVATITVIYAAGMPAIRSQEDIAVFRSMENTFYVLQNVERLVAYNITPEKSVSVRVEGGSIAVVPDWGKITIVAWYGSSPHPTRGNIIFGPVTYSYGAIIYIGKNGRFLILENGAVIACYSGNRFLNLLDPRILSLYHSNKLDLYFSIINVTGALGFTGSKSIVFRNIGSSINNSLRLDTLNPALHWSGQPQNLRITIKELKADQLGINGDRLSEFWINTYFKPLFNSTALNIIAINNTSITVQIRGLGYKATPIKSINLTVGYYNITVSG